MARPSAHDPLFEPLRIGCHALPSIWRYLLPEEAQWLTLPRERLAHCDPCYQARLGNCRDDCRCCTYFPQLPNFLVGLALKDPTSRPAMLSVIQAHHALPSGLMPTPSQFSRALETHADNRFGEVPDQICPFFRDADYRCAIHPYRNSICATFFCEHDHGQEGAHTWRAFQALAGHAETALGHWAMDEVGLSSSDMFAELDRLADKIDALQTGSVWSARAREALWGDWLGREVSFFEACAEAVMAHRNELYEIACRRPIIEARRYERALLAALPAELVAFAPPPSEGETIPLPGLWYGLQLRLRQLFALPFGEQPVQLAPGLRMEANPRDDLLSRAHDEPAALRDGKGKPLLFCGEDEARALELFSTPQVLGEALFARPEIEALPEVRLRLSEWMRRGILVERGGR